MENLLVHRNVTSVAGSVVCVCVCVCGDNHRSKVFSFALSSFSKKQHENKYVTRVNGKGKGNFTLEQATKTQRGVEVYVTLLFL